MYDYIGDYIGYVKSEVKNLIKKQKVKRNIKRKGYEIPNDIVVYFLRKIAFSIKGQLSPKDEIELLAQQIAKLIKKGWDQLKIMRLLVNEGLTTAEVFKKAWELYMKEYAKYTI